MMTQIIDTCKKIISSPREFFAKLKVENTSEPYKFFTFTSIPYAILAGIFVKFNIVAAISKLPASFPISTETINAVTTLPILIIGGYVGMHILFWVIVSLWHVFFKMLGGRGTYAATAQVYAYSTLPTRAFGWIPAIGSLVGIWSLVLSYIATMKVHKLSSARTIVALIIFPVALMLIVVTVLAIIVGILIGLNKATAIA